jgi:hypothetical protein
MDDSNGPAPDAYEQASNHYASNNFAAALPLFQQVLDETKGKLPPAAEWDLVVVITACHRKMGNHAAATVCMDRLLVLRHIINGPTSCIICGHPTAPQLCSVCKQARCCDRCHMDHEKACVTLPME